MIATLDSDTDVLNKFEPPISVDTSEVRIEMMRRIHQIRRMASQREIASGFWTADELMA